MTQPPEVGPHRTETQQLEDGIVKACRTIREYWDDMLPTDPGPVRYGTGRSAGILGDNSPPDGINSKGKPYWRSDRPKGDHDIDGMTRLVDLRRKTTADLHGWCRAIVTDRGTKGGIPDGFDVPGMCRFLTLHSNWFAHQDFARCALDELEDDARAVKGVVDAYRKEWHKVGPCVLTVDDRPCQGVVQIPVAADDDVATCTHCGKGERVHWWQEAMGKAKREFVLAGEMSRILHDRLHITASAVTVKRWARDGRIPSRFLPPLGPWPEGHPPEGDRHWFEVDVVLHEIALMDRVCPMCGGLWSGEGQVCLRCYSAAKDVHVTYGDDAPAYSVVPIPKRPSVTRPDLSRDERVTDEHGKGKSQPRCANTDMPLRWCGCGKTHQVTA